MKKSFFGNMFKQMKIVEFNYDDFSDCMDALKNEDPTIRVNAIDAITKVHLSNINDIDVFSEIMRNDDNFQVQEAAMTLLGTFGGTESINELVGMLSSPDQWLRVKAISVLSGMKDIRAYNAIKDAYTGIKSEYQQSIKRAIEQMEEDLNITETETQTEAAAPTKMIAHDFLPPAQEAASATHLSYEIIDDDEDTTSASDSVNSYLKNIESKEAAAAASVPPTSPPVHTPPPSPAAAAPLHSAVQEPAPAAVKQSVPAQTYKQPPPLRAEIPASAYPSRRDSAESQSAKQPQPPTPPQAKSDERKDGKVMVSQMLAYQLKATSGEEADPEVLRAYIAAFTVRNEQAQQYLCSCVANPNHTVAVQALQALTCLNTPEKFKPVYFSILKKDSQEMNLRALIPLLTVYDHDTASAIFPFVYHKNERLKNFAINYFTGSDGRDMSEFVYLKTQTGGETEKLAAASLIARMDTDEARPVLKKLLQNPQTSDSMVTAVFDRLSPRYKDVVISSLPSLIQRNDEQIFSRLKTFISKTEDLIAEEFLLLNLQNKNPFLRARSLTLLAEIKSNKAEQYIPVMAADDSDLVRLAAARAIAAYKNPESYELLNKLYQTEKHIPNKAEYVKLIFQMSGKQATQQMLLALDTAVPEIQCAILEALGKTQHDEYLQQVLRQIKKFYASKDMRIVYYALTAAIKLGDIDLGSYRQNMLRMLWNLTNDSRTPAKIRRESLECLCTAAKEESYTMLADILKLEKDESLVLTAMQYIAFYRDDKTKQLLIEKTSSQNKNISETAQKLIKSFGK